MVLFLIFFPKPGPEPHPADSPPPPTWQTALGVVLTSVAHFFILLVCSSIFLLWYPSVLQTWATVLGLGAAFLACVQYIPQLWTTWRLQHVMSLSIPMMCIQTPGSFVFAASLAARLGAGGWSAWGVYIVTGCLQGCLLAMGITFELRDRKKRKADQLAQSENDTDDPNERTALLGKLCLWRFRKDLTLTKLKDLRMVMPFTAQCRLETPEVVISRPFEPHEYCPSWSDRIPT